MRYFAAAAVSLLLAACTSANPSFGPGGTDQGIGVPDSGAPDGGAPDGPPADLAEVGIDLGLCKDGERTCLGGSSAVCAPAGFELDRRCPMSSMCKTGYCQPPPRGMGAEGEACELGGEVSEVRCLQLLSCQPFVSSPAKSEVSWICANPVGQGLPGAVCTSGGQCRSGFCASNGTCFRACTTVGDCPTGTPFSCSPVKITVEGVELTAKSCVP